MATTHLFTRRSQLLSIGIAFGAAFFAHMGSAVAQSTASSDPALDGQDRKFVEAAAQGGLAEVAMGEMAQKRGTHAQVKAFGVRMVNDHTKANGELKRVASTKGVALPTRLDKEQQEHADALGKLSGADFDRAYMEHMVDDHKKDVSNFETAAKSAKDADVKSFAARTLPTLKTHLELAQKTQAALK